MFVALLLATAAALAPPYLAGRAIDDGIRGGDVGALDVIVVAVPASRALVNWGATYVQTYLVNWVGQRALQDLRLRHLRAPPAAVDRLLLAQQGGRADLADDERRGGARPARHRRHRDAVLVDADAARRRGDPVRCSTPSSRSSRSSTFPILLVGSIAFRIASAGAYRRRARRSRSITAYLQETLSGIRVVRAFGQERRHEERFAELNDENREANMKTVYLNAAYFPSVELLSAVATAVILLYGGIQVLDGDGVTIGVLASFVFYLTLFFDPIQQLSQLYTTYQSGMAALDKIFELLDEKPDLVDAAGRRRAAARSRGEIRFEDVSFATAPTRRARRSRCATST